MTTAALSFLSRRPALWLAVLAAALGFGAFLMDGNVGLNLADEGFLWYGMHALKEGQIPIRDFYAYDPGRYFWVAGWSYLLGDGLVSLRAACVIFQCLGVWCGLLAATRISRDGKFLFAVALTLSLWMTPRFKLFEQSIALMGIYVAVRLIELPTARQHFLSGLFVGFMAFMGRNHGAYLLVSFGLVACFLARGEWRQLPGRALALGCGIAIGYLPQWIMLATVPGYFHAYVDRLQMDVAFGTNIPIPVPWPWRIPDGVGGLFWLDAFAQGCFYLGIPLVVAAAFLLLLFGGREKVRQHPVLLATACIALAYSHYAFSRADFPHLAHAAPPFLLALIAAGSLVRKVSPLAVAAGALAATVPATVLHTGAAAEWMSDRPLLPVEVRGQEMHVPLYSAAILQAADRIAHQLSQPEDQVLFMPHWPGLYAALGRRSPFKQIYFTGAASPRDEDEQLAILCEKRVKWAMLQDYKLDGRDELRVMNTNPRTMAYLREHFRRYEMPGLPADTVVLKRVE